MQSFKRFSSQVYVLWNILEDVLHQTKGVNQGRKCYETQQREEEFLG